MSRVAKRSLLAIAGVVALGAAITVAHREPTPTGPPCQVALDGQTVGLSVEQAENATTIAAVASRMAISNHAVTVALATALQESKLYNLDYGDLDSVGLFQQRPSQGWGTVDQIMVPQYAATKFYDHLLDVRGWDDLSVNDAAQRVQRSAFPDAYAQWEGQARSGARALTGEVPAAFTCRSAAERNVGAVSALNDELRADAGSPGIGTTVTAQRGWMLASWLIARSERFGITSVTFASQRWSADTSRWEPYTKNENVVRVNV